MFKPLCATLLCLLCWSGLQANELRDPMRPPATASKPSAKASTTPSLQLESIMISGAQRTAIINGQHLREGDRLQGARVKQIQTTQVILRVGQQQQVLRLVPLSVKTPSTRPPHE